MIDQKSALVKLKLLRCRAATIVAVLAIAATMVAAPTAATPGGDDTPSRGTGVGSGGPADVGNLLDPDPVAHTGAATYTLVSTPGDDAPQGLATVDGTDTVSTLTKTLDDGAFLAVLIIDDVVDPTEFRFQGAVPDGHTAEVQADGSVAIFDIHGNRAGGWEKPWAIDDEGETVTTSFTVEDDTLIQTVEHIGHAYPVIADPCGGWRNFFSCTVAAGAVLGAAAVCLGSVGLGCAGAVLVAVGTVGVVVVDHLESRPPPRSRPTPSPAPSSCSRPGCR